MWNGDLVIVGGTGLAGGEVGIAGAGFPHEETSPGPFSYVSSVLLISLPEPRILLPFWYLLCCW